VSELSIVRARGGGFWLVDDEGNREWFPSYEAAEAAIPPASRRFLT
jgi:hypothetical protein